MNTLYHNSATECRNVNGNGSHEHAKENLCIINNLHKKIMLECVETQLNSIMKTQPLQPARYTDNELIGV